MRRPGKCAAGLGLLLGVIGAPLIAQDHESAVRNAFESQRFAMRRAAAAQVARAGDDAIPALRAKLAADPTVIPPLELVDAIAKSDGGEATRTLLRDWAADRAFAWRAQALGGLARRADPVDHARFREGLADKSHAFRIEAARGLLEVAGDDGDREAVAGLLRDDDPRCRVRVALALLARDDPRGVAEIVVAIEGQDRRFLDDPWGAREAQECVRALRDLDVDASAAVGAPSPERDAARERLRAWARGRLPDAALPDALPPTDADFDGGLEIRSCRNGDVFFRWTNSGRVAFGLSPLREATLDGDAIAALRDALAKTPGVAVHGTVICDFLRVRATAADGVAIHHKVAPGTLPDSLAEWLKQTAALLEKTDGESTARLLVDRLPQFVRERGAR